MKRFWYYFPVFSVAFGIFGALLPHKSSQKIFLLALLICGLCLIVQVTQVKKNAGKQEKWFDYFFPVLYCIFPWMLGYIWGMQNGDHVAFILAGILLGKLCMLATYHQFRWFHAVLYLLFLQLTWEFSYAIKWIKQGPLIGVFT